MEAIGLLILGVLAQSTPLLADPSMYELVNEAVSWSTARSYCQEHFFDLAIISNAEQLATVEEIILNSSSDRAWIGLHDDKANAWRWSLNKVYVDTIGESWFVSSLNNYGGRQACGYLLQGTLYDASCSSTYKSVCWDERFNAYIPVTVPMTWYDAQRYCREIHTDLSSIRDQQEMDDLVSLTNSTEWWVGLFRHTFVWSGDSISGFRSWVSGEPNKWDENCVAALTFGWIDLICGRMIPFMCSVGRRTKVVNIWLKTPASLNISDPKILEDLATQMQSHMISQQIQQAFKLIWRKQVHGDVFSRRSAV